MADDDKTDKGEDAELDLWAEAMAEQEAGEAGDTDDTASEDDGGEDLWAAAMAEQQAEEQAEADADANAGGAAAEPQPGKRADPPPPAAEAAGERVFRPLEHGTESHENRDLAMIMDIPVKLSVELGRTKVTIKQLLEMAQGSVVELDGLAGEPMDILINGYLIAQGEVVVVDDKYGIRITEIISPSERVQKLNR